MDEITELEMQSEQSEQALIGAVSFHPDALAGVLAELPGSDFYRWSRGVVWDACRTLSADRKPITPTDVARYLAENGGWDDAARRIVTREMSTAAAASHAPAHAATVADLARRRELLRLISAARVLVRDHPGDASDILAAIRESFDTTDHQDREQGGTRTWTQMIEEFTRAHSPGAAQRGIDTPWKQFNSLIGGLFGGRLYVIGGSAGDGKSTAALNIAHTAAADGHHVLVFSKEMPVLDVFGRLRSAPSSVELAQINRHGLTDWQLDKIERDARAAALPIRVNADQVSIAGVKTIARAYHHRGQLDLLVVDYLQLIDSGQNTRSQEEEIAKVSTALKQLAMELDIPLVVPAQLNRSPHARPDARPTKADLRGSGRIEQDADVVLLLWHPVDDHGKRTGKVVFILDKHRHGAKGEVELEFNGGYGSIKELS